MTYYYKATEAKSREIISTLDNIKKYDKVVMDWLRENFKIDENGQFIPFNDIPSFTNSIIEDNPELKPLMNKTNYRLNQRKAESKEFIKSWKDYKWENGFKVNESHDRSNYVIILRSMFPFGSVDPLIDKENEVVYFRVSSPSQSKNLIESDMKEYNLKEIELEESK